MQAVVLAAGKGTRLRPLADDKPKVLVEVNGTPLIEDVFVLTTNFNIHLTRPVSEGEIRAEGRVVNENPRQLIGEAVAYDDDGNQVARGSGTFAKSNSELRPEIGYE